MVLGVPVLKPNRAKLQIRRGIEDDSEYNFSYFSMQNICSDPSLEQSRRDFDNDGSQNMF